MTQLSALFSIGIIIILIKGIQSCESIVEKGQREQFQCAFQSNQNSITWQVVNGNNAVNLTTCNLTSRVCIDQQPSVYKGRVISSVPRNYTISLDITSARINETKFRCVTDLGDVSDKCTLHVYKWPSIPTVSVEITSSYVQLTFSTYSYPAIQARLNRRENALTNDDITSGHCNISHYTSDPNGDYHAVCTWRMAMAGMLLNSTFYAEMTVGDTRDLQVNRPAVVSEDILVDLGTVNVRLVDCPAGPYVNGTVILKGQSATCTCQVTTTGRFLTARAQWYTSLRRIFQVETPNEGTAILTVSFSPEDPHAVYECRGANPTRQYPSIRYQPEFSSELTTIPTTAKTATTPELTTIPTTAKTATTRRMSSSGSILNGIQPKLILFLLLMWAGLASKLF